MLASYKVYLCFIVLSVTVCTVGYVCLICGDQIFMDFISFLSIIIYEVLCNNYKMYKKFEFEKGSRDRNKK